MLTFCPKDPAAYGRIIRDGKNLAAVREYRDCSPSERAIRECNAGIYMIDIGFLRKSIRQLKSDNDQNELYLTDLVAIASADGGAKAVTVAPELVIGINDRAELASIEAQLSHVRNLALMRSGVSMVAPETIRVDLGVQIKPDTTLQPGVQLTGATRIGEGCTIGQGSIIHDTIIDDNVLVKPYSVFEKATIATGAEIGPMARLRPGADIGPDARIGNWVEVKNSRIGKGSKANHLSYLGDGDVGEGVNIGAGTIFCNYDGFLKHRTTIGDGVFVGSDSQLVSPVSIGRDAYIASGSTITQDVPDEALALSRIRQTNLEKRATILKKKLRAEKKRRLAADKRKTRQRKAK
jgi:bifunctional UDP-N-acetylglucosamine pyrophosphorylase/glucosamine-1-phosphate N-acetyltransferase